jgi:glycosyltransferase involved in cell wall biosynthesis
MRIAWLSPVDRDSAVALFSHRVVTALRRRAEVELWAPNRERPLAAPDVVLTEDRRWAERLKHFDAVVHNLGNSLRFHHEIHDLSRRYPGVMILHDRSLNGFYASLLGERREHSEYIELAEELYGIEGREVAVDLLTGRLGLRWSESETVLELPFTEAALAGQHAAVVHSSAHRDDVARRWPGPVMELPFPVYPEWLQPVQKPSSPGARLTLVTAGHVNRNKHVHDVIKVLGADPWLAARVRYLVVGDLRPDRPYGLELDRLISRCALTDTVKLFGYQPADAFSLLTKQADVFVNLRYPALESGSASAAEQLASGRPLVVYDTGSFADLPDDAVVKVPVRDLRGLREALVSLVADPCARTSVAAAARHVAQTRSVESYADSLLEFLAQVERWPWGSYRQQVADQLHELGIDEGMAAFGRVGRELSSVLPAPDSPSTAELIDRAR